MATVAAPDWKRARELLRCDAASCVPRAEWWEGEGAGCELELGWAPWHSTRAKRPWQRESHLPP
eukprot:scaffold41939_cov23-Tisochrysis_lutea.AAC.6